MLHGTLLLLIRFSSFNLHRLNKKINKFFAAFCSKNHLSSSCDPGSINSTDSIFSGSGVTTKGVRIDTQEITAIKPQII